MNDGTNYGIKIKFTADYGHVVDDIWSFVQGAMRGLSIQDSSGTEYVEASNGGFNITKMLIGNGDTVLGVKAGHVTIGGQTHSDIVLPSNGGTWEGTVTWKSTGTGDITLPKGSFIQGTPDKFRVTNTDPSSYSFYYVIIRTQ